ncbi:hypothetical protein T484DRAFT_1843265 [Baffinella frigidus]|nr:hypothetical protein T484DRAFT_1843265 [Cryptophyta sp. CCMP2293]
MRRSELVAVGCVLVVLAIAPLLMFHSSTASSDPQSQPLQHKSPSKGPKIATASQEHQARVLSTLDAAAPHDPPVDIRKPPPAPTLPVQPSAAANALRGVGAQAPAADAASVVPELAPLPAAGVPEIEPPAPLPASKPVPAPAPAPDPAPAIPAVVLSAKEDAAHIADGQKPPSDSSDKPVEFGAPEHGAEDKDADAPRKSGSEKGTHEGGATTSS